MRKKTFLSLFPSLVVALDLLAGCAAIRPESFKHVSRIEVELKRGVSTKADVERVIGKPDGTGQAFLPTDTRQHAVWYYEDIAVTQVSRGARGSVLSEIRQQILVMTFDGDLFDGFFWFSNAGARSDSPQGEAK